MISLLKFIWWSFVAVVSVLVLSFSGTFLYLSPNLPSAETLRQVQLQIPLRIYSSDGKLIAEFGEMRRSPISFDEIPPDFISALLAAEDDNFAKHHGVDFTSLARAATELVKTGQIQTGGSTITMQVAKNFFLTSERSFARKINEILLALQIERELSKNEILELYVNKIYLGNRAYGIEAAAQVYYGKSIKDLDLAQMAMIAGLPKAPSRYNPLVNPTRAKERRDWILGRLYRLGRIDQQRYQETLAAPIDASYHVQPPEVSAPYIAEMARAEMVGRYGSDAYTEGFNVTVTVPSELQEAANDSLRNGLISYDQRHGYRGPEAQLGDADQEKWLEELKKFSAIGGLQPAVVTQVENDHIQVMLRDETEHAVSWDTMKWARKFLSSNGMGPAPKRPSDVVKVGDVIRVQPRTVEIKKPAKEGEEATIEIQETLRFVQVPAAQAALVSLDPHDGAILSLVGGFSFDQSHYNRATQAKRQPGSSFKPFIYSYALDRGFTASTLINDSPIVFKDPHQKEWRPKNDNNTFLGPIRLREGLYRSRNLVSIRLLQNLGINDTIEYLEKFGFARHDLPPGLSLALGTADVTPMEVATGWTVFANGGYKIEPYLIKTIEDREGNRLFTANPPRVPTGKKAAAPAPAAETETPDTEAEEIASNDDNLQEAEAPKQAVQVIDERTAYIMTSILQDVIRRGTGRRALALNRDDLAGKTGTTNESKDSWFSGYNADYVTTVWAGFDQPVSLGRREFGSTLALPMWIDYMGIVLKDKPSHKLPEPPGIVSIRVDSRTGRAAPPGAPGAYFELFKSETSPGQGSGADPFPASQPVDSGPSLLDIF